MTDQTFDAVAALRGKYNREAEKQLAREKRQECEAALWRAIASVAQWNDDVQGWVFCPQAPTNDLEDDAAALVEWDDDETARTRGR